MLLGTVACDIDNECEKLNYKAYKAVKYLEDVDVSAYECHHVGLFRYVRNKTLNVNVLADACLCNVTHPKRAIGETLAESEACLYGIHPFSRCRDEVLFGELPFPTLFFQD